MATARSRRIRKRIGLTALALAILAVTSFLVWCSILYDATPRQFKDVADDAAITIVEHPEVVVLEPSGERNGTGLLFVPGAKVEAEAYAYKLAALVDDGTTVVISKPILNLAFFDLRPMSTFTDLAPEVTSWYVGGHSLGGVKACQFADGPDVVGLVLFGSYCANDLSQSGIRVLSIGGSNDGLSTPAKIKETSNELPPSARFVEIDGSNHAQFGNYGPQPGDGVSTVSDDDVKKRIDELLLGFVS